MTDMLVIAPHADDAELGLGGYLHRTIREHGTKVTIAVCCASTIRMVSSGSEVSGKTRLHEQQRAAESLGGAKVTFLRMGRENALDMEPQEKLIHIAETLIETEKPTEIFLPLPSYNQDHRAVYDAFITALRPTRITVPEVWAYELPMQFWGPQEPIGGRCYVRLDAEDMSAKIEALSCHQSQMAGREDSLTGLAGARNLARIRGSQCGAEFAEMLYLLRWVY